MDIQLLYGLVERMAYVAYRPTSSRPEERGVAMLLNYAICSIDRASAKSVHHEAAVALMSEWIEAGKRLVSGEHWSGAATLSPNPVDSPVPNGDDLLRRLSEGDVSAHTAVSTVALQFTSSAMCMVVRHLPLYHARIRRDLPMGTGIPLICRVIIGSMRRNVFITGYVDGHEWALTTVTLRWGAGGYALLNQAYARNSALAYVGQLAIIVVNVTGKKPKTGRVVPFLFLAAALMYRCAKGVTMFLFLQLKCHYCGRPLQVCGRSRFWGKFVTD